jgi:hypothetical protein
VTPWSPSQVCGSCGEWLPHACAAVALAVPLTDFPAQQARDWPPAGGSNPRSPERPACEQTAPGTPSEGSTSMPPHRDQAAARTAALREAGYDGPVDYLGFADSGDRAADMARNYWAGRDARQEAEGKAGGKDRAAGHPEREREAG